MSPNHEEEDINRSLHYYNIAREMYQVKVQLQLKLIAPGPSRITPLLSATLTFGYEMHMDVIRHP